MIPQIPPVIQGRALGHFPVSIATSQALESLLGVNTDEQRQTNASPPYKEFSNLTINLRTLARNILGSVSSQNFGFFNNGILAALIMEEVSIINEVVADHTRKQLQVFYYAGMYRDLASDFPNADTKSKFTPKQAISIAMEKEAFDLLNDKRYNKPFLKLADDTVLNITKNQPTPGVKLANRATQPTVCLTHIPLDLLLLKLPRLYLLESHTGKIKSKNEWYTKLKSAPESIPFNLATIQLYGDTAGMFNPMDRDLRKKISEISKNKYWSSVTSKEKILLDCQVQDKDVFNTIRNLFK